MTDQDEPMPVVLFEQEDDESDDRQPTKKQNHARRLSMRQHKSFTLRSKSKDSAYQDDFSKNGIKRANSSRSRSN